MNNHQKPTLGLPKKQPVSDVEFVTHRGVTHIIDHDRGDKYPWDEEREAMQKDAELAAQGWRS